jgi:hypothetical protein
LDIDGGKEAGDGRMRGWRGLTTVAVLVLAASNNQSAFAAPTDYDGTWHVEYSCGVSTLGYPAFHAELDFKIFNGALSGQQSGPYIVKPYRFTETFSGNVQSGMLHIHVDGSAENRDRWEREWVGTAISPTQMTLTGRNFGFPHNTRTLTRNCSGQAFSTAPLPASLAGVLAAQQAAQPVALPNLPPQIQPPQPTTTAVTNTGSWPGHAGPVTDQDAADLTKMFDDKTVADLAAFLKPLGWTLQRPVAGTPLKPGATVRCSYSFTKGDQELSTAPRCGGGETDLNGVLISSFDAGITLARKELPPSPPVAPASAIGAGPSGAGKTITLCDRLAASADTFAGYELLSTAGLIDQHFNGGVSYDRIDPRQAIPACQAAVQRTLTDGRVWFQFGRALEKGNRLGEAIAAYQKAADLGSPDGLNNLAELYRDGKGFAKSPAVAERLFLKAARGGSFEAAVSLVNILLARRVGADLDLALTISKLNIPTDVSISMRMIERHGAAMARIPAAVAKPVGPESYRADIVVEIAPNTPSGMYCVQSAGKPVCVPSDRLHIRANDVEVRNEPPPITALNGHEATVSPTTDISLALVDKPIAMVQYIDQVDAIFKDVIVVNSPKASVQGGEGPMQVTLNALFRVDSNCWQGNDGKICVIPTMAAIRAGQTVPPNSVAAAGSATGPVWVKPETDSARVLWSQDRPDGRKVTLYQRANGTIYCVSCIAATSLPQDVKIDAADLDILKLMVGVEGAANDVVLLSVYMGSACNDNSYFAVSLSKLTFESVDVPQTCGKGVSSVAISPDGNGMLAVFTLGQGDKITRHIN